MADTSIRSTNSNISRATRPESGRLHRKYPYRWLFDQVHVKSLIFHAEVFMLAAALIGLFRASQMSTDQYFDPFPIPGFDGFSWTGEIIKTYDGVPIRPYYMTARNIINIFSYFLIFSVITGFFGMRLSETSVNRRNFPTQMNPAFLLMPSAFSVICFLYPLSVWTMQAVHSTIRTLIKDNLKLSIVLNAFRFSLLPIVIVWVFYLYFLYGFFLGVYYYQRRGDQPSPISHNSPFRRPIRKCTGFRFQGKAGINLLSDQTAVTNELSAVTPSNCPLSSLSASTTSSAAAKHSRSVPPRGICHLETVDEEAHSRTSSD